MTVELIRDQRSARAVSESAEEHGQLAIDCEAAGFHRYSDRLCLLQVTTRARTWVLDPLAFDPSEVLRGPLESESIEVVMHGSDYDLRLLDRDLGIRPRRIFDTQVAAALLGEEQVGLSSLLERHLDIKMTKKYQRADWARRPLPEDMLAYAANDTRHLPELRALLGDALERTDRSSWAREEFVALEDTVWEDDPAADPVTRVKGARDLDPEDLEVLREAIAWRDEIARRRDRAPFRVVDDRGLMAVVDERPGSVEELAGVRGFSRGLASSDGAELLSRLAGARGRPPAERTPYPRPDRGATAGRPPPEVEERLTALKRVRNRRARELGIARGTLAPNSTLLEIAWREPSDFRSPDDLPAKRWQVEVAGADLLGVLVGDNGQDGDSAS